MQRMILGIGLIGLLATAFTGTAVADHDGECMLPEGCACPEYEPVVFVDEAGTGVSRGAHGETRVTAANALYLDVEELLSHGYLFSIWIGAESNGEPGYQDSRCSDNPDTALF